MTLGQEQMPKQISCGDLRDLGVTSVLVVEFFVVIIYSITVVEGPKRASRIPGSDLKVRSYRVKCR